MRSVKVWARLQPALLALALVTLAGAAGAADVGYGGYLGAYTRGAEVPIGYSYIDTMKVAAGSGYAADTLKIRVGGHPVPIRRLELRYYGTSRDTLIAEYGWSNPASTFRVTMIVDSTAFRYDRYDINAEWIRIRPFATVSTGEIHLIGLGAP